MAQKQTFIILHWCGGFATYSDAIKNGAKHDFDRVGCKRLSTAIKYLTNWIKEARDGGWGFLYPTFVDAEENARFAIVATPDGYTETEIVAEGWIKDLARLGVGK